MMKIWISVRCVEEEEKTKTTGTHLPRPLYPLIHRHTQTRSTQAGVKKRGHRVPSLEFPHRSRRIVRMCARPRVFS